MRGECPWLSLQSCSDIMGLHFPLSWDIIPQFIKRTHFKSWEILQRYLLLQKNILKVKFNGNLHIYCKAAYGSAFSALGCPSENWTPTLAVSELNGTILDQFLYKKHQINTASNPDAQGCLVSNISLPEAPPIDGMSLTVGVIGWCSVTDSFGWLPEDILRSMLPQHSNLWHEGSSMWTCKFSRHVVEVVRGALLS